MDTNQAALSQDILDRGPGDGQAEPPSLLAPITLEGQAGLRAGTGEAGTMPPGTRRHGLRRLLVLGAGLAAVAGGAYFGRDYWLVGRFYVSTDDAYVEADTITIAPKVPGYLVQGARRRQRTGEGGPGARADRCARLHGGARPDPRRCRCRGRGDRQQAGRNRRAAVEHRVRQGHDPGRPLQRSLRGAGDPARRLPGKDRVRVRAERAAGGVAHRRLVGRHSA